MFSSLWQSALILLPARFQTAEGPLELLGRVTRPPEPAPMTLQQVLAHNAEAQKAHAAMAMQRAQAVMGANADGAWTGTTDQAISRLAAERTPSPVSAESSSAAVPTPTPLPIPAPRPVTPPSTPPAFTGPVQVAAPIVLTDLDHLAPDFEVIPDDVLALLDAHYAEMDGDHPESAFSNSILPEMPEGVELALLPGQPAPSALERLAHEHAEREAHIASLTSGALELPDLDGITMPGEAQALLTALRGRGQQTIRNSLNAVARQTAQHSAST